MVKVHLEMKREFRLGDKGKKFKKELLDLLANDGVLIMESVTPRGYTGNGAKSYKVINKNEDSRIIQNDRFYLPYVNDGTVIYGRGSPIVPVKAKMLHFWVGGAPHAGQEVFARSVRGQPGKHFVEKGARDIANSVSKVAVIAARRTFE